MKSKWDGLVKDAEDASMTHEERAAFVEADAKLAAEAVRQAAMTPAERAAHIKRTKHLHDKMQSSYAPEAE